MTKYQVDHVKQSPAGPGSLPAGRQVGNRLQPRLTSRKTVDLGYSSSPAMRKPRTKSMVFCRSFGVCLPTMLGGGRMRRLAKSVAETQEQDRGFILLYKICIISSAKTMYKNWNHWPFKEIYYMTAPQNVKPKHLHCPLVASCSDMIGTSLSIKTQHVHVNYIFHLTKHSDVWF